MAGNRKPNRKPAAKLTGNRNYSKARIPMTASTLWAEQFGLHAAVETLIARPCVESFNNVAERMNKLTVVKARLSGNGDLRQDRSPLGVALRTLGLPVVHISERHNDTGNYYVLAGEAESLRRGAALVDPLLKTIPYDVLQASDMAAKIINAQAQAEMAVARENGQHKTQVVAIEAECF